MSFLPKNERKVAVETPRVFVVYGESMHGKTYFADEFPNPVIFNTDDNARAIETPSVAIYNGIEKVVNGANKTLTAFEYMAHSMEELANRDDHGFETVVIDTTEDFFFMLQDALAASHDREFFSDIPHGNGWFKYRSLYTKFVLSLKKLTLTKDMFVVYIIRAIDKTENKITVKVPNIGDKELAVINGNSDYRILCQKIGRNYIRRAVLKRKNYVREKIGDDRILKILDTVNGAFDKSQRITRDQQDKIVEAIEADEDVLTKKEEADEAKKTPSPSKGVIQQKETTEPTESKDTPEPKEPKEPIKPPREAPTNTATPKATPTTRTARPARPPRRAR